MRVVPYFRWFDFWVGVYYDRPRSHRDGGRLYVQIVPCIGLRIHLPEPKET